MISRRHFSLSTAAAVGGLSGLQACAPASGVGSYEQAVAETWRHGRPGAAGAADLQRELVRYATLAPSSHNTQCWKFRLAERAIHILPDLSRRCPAVDPDDHHLFVSLGCAAENLVHAALAHGLKGEVDFDAAATVVRVRLEPAPAAASPLFQAIPQRQCTRGDYDGQPLSPQDLALLQQAGSSPGVQLSLLTERSAMERVLDFVLQGNAAQMSDPAFVDELKVWIRFSGSDAVRSGDGLYAASSGSPPLPAWLGRPMFSLFFTTHGENDKYARQLRSSAGIAVFAGAAADAVHWVEVGRCYERFALQATALGVRNAMLNQPVEVTALRAPFASAMGLGTGRPDLVVRFGRGPEMRPSLRRPVQAVLV
ncbi:MAG: Tat pathway signal protein [Leptothrix sp. (in: Bacteria)]|nr:Tat pathway signal protein [Leptothrix sp. (in: b-proteobacteria)]